MAFDSLTGQKIISPQSGEVFILADYFAVYNNSGDIPFVYRWEEIDSIIESVYSITFETGEMRYTIPKSAFTSNAHLLVSRAIIEGQIANHPDIKYKTIHRILPIKCNYKKFAQSNSSYIATGKYVDRDINSGYAAMQSSKMSKFLWIIGLIVAVVFFVALYMFYAEAESNWVYYLLIAAFAGTIMSTLLFLLFSLISNMRFKDYAKLDRATDENIIFVVNSDGFAAIEQCVFSEGELIPWSFADGYFETKYTYIITLRDGSVLWLPKQLFEKSQQTAIGKFIVSHISA